MPDDLRHDSDSNDLQSTCRTLRVQSSDEIKKLRAENEELKSVVEDLKAQPTGGPDKDLLAIIENLKTELEASRSQSKRFNDMMNDEMVVKSNGDSSGESGGVKIVEMLNGKAVSATFDPFLTFLNFLAFSPIRNSNPKKPKH